jgi:hypothetical protein
MEIRYEMRRPISEAGRERDCGGPCNGNCMLTSAGPPLGTGEKLFSNSAAQEDAAIVLSQLVPEAPMTIEFVRDVVRASEGRMHLEGGLVHVQPSGWRRRGAGEAARFDAFGKGTRKGKGRGKGRGKDRCKGRWKWGATGGKYPWRA